MFKISRCITLIILMDSFYKPVLKTDLFQFITKSLYSSLCDYKTVFKPKGSVKEISQNILTESRTLSVLMSSWV